MGLVFLVGPEVLVLLEPVAEGAFRADVETGFLGFESLVFEDFVALLEKEMPELALLKGFRNRRDAFFVGMILVPQSI